MPSSDIAMRMVTKLLLLASFRHLFMSTAPKTGGLRLGFAMQSAVPFCGLSHVLSPFCIRQIVHYSLHIWEDAKHSPCLHAACMELFEGCVKPRFSNSCVCQNGG